MTHDELLEKIETILGSYISKYYGNKKDVELRSNIIDSLQALRAVVVRHKPIQSPGKSILWCNVCKEYDELDGSYRISYPCPTIQAIEKELT